MGFELDPFDDVFAEPAPKNARAGGKFQPKFKPQPKKGISESVLGTKTSQPANNGSIQLPPLVVSSSATFGTLGDTDPLKGREYPVSEDHLSSGTGNSGYNPSSDCVVNTREVVDVMDGASQNIVMSESNGDWNSSSSGKSGIENSDIFFGLDDFLSQSTTAKVGTADRSPPKGNMAAELKNDFHTPSSVNTDDETLLPLSEKTTSHASNSRNREEGLGFPVDSHVDDSTCWVSDASLAHQYPRVSMTHDPSTDGAETVSTIGGDFQVDNCTIGTEEVEAFHCWDDIDFTSELTACPGQRAGKFQPKPKLQAVKQKNSSATSNPDLLESVTFQPHTRSDPSDTVYTTEGSTPAILPDEVPEVSPLNFHDSVAANNTSELWVNGEPSKVADTFQSDAVIHEDDGKAVSSVPGKSRSKSGRRKIPAVSDLSMNNQEASTAGRENATARPLTRLRKRINACELIDEPEDDAHDDAHPPVDHLNNSVVSGDDENDDNYQVENEPQNRRAPGNIKKPVVEKEKPARKRRKANQVQDQTTKERPKKFSHSTRRNKRKVDKVLLETPEDEIDPQKLRIRDLILLAEYKERMSKKEHMTLETPITGHSAGNSFTHYNEDGTFASERGGDSYDEQTSPKAQESSSYFNYQSYMDKTPIARWSKQDTELFYEAVRQFGTDLSLIQQLFPDRTRRQVKLKFKKEERQHPLRFQEALTNRTKDLTHFEQVIRHLQEAAAQEKQNSNGEDSVDLTGEEVELTPENNDEQEEAAKSEQIEEEVDAGVTEVQSPIKSDESEDDVYRWNQYKSEF